MTGIEPLVRIPVGVVVERRKAKSAWAEFTWRPTAVLAGIPEAQAWTVLRDEADTTTFYAGAIEITLFRADSAGYRDNLRHDMPALWVALRPTGDAERPYAISAITADPGEGESFSETATNLVEAVAMPDSVREIIAQFVDEHYVDRPFLKRQRDRANLEALAAPARTRNGKL
jgi:Protein of unknown function (DUF3305)